MISATKPTLYKDSPTCIKLVGINPKAIKDDLIRKKAAGVLNKSRRGHEGSTRVINKGQSDTFSNQTDILDKKSTSSKLKNLKSDLLQEDLVNSNSSYNTSQNNIIYLSRFSDPGGRLIPQQNKISLNHRRLYTPHLDNTVFKNLKGDPYLNLALKAKVCCFWDRNEIDTTPMPIPCKVEFLSKDNTLSNSNSTPLETTLIIHGEGWLCSLECALAFIDEEESKVVSKRDINYKYVRGNIDIIFHYMCKFLSEDVTLISAPDWRLLKYTGYGDMDIKEFRSQVNTFVKLPFIKFYPLQRCYHIL